MKYFSVATILALFIMIGCQPSQEDQAAQQMPQEQMQPEQQPQPDFSPQEPTAGVSISDEEIDLFIEVSRSVQDVQMESQAEMIEIVEEEGMDVDTYNQIAQARFEGTADEELEVTEDELETFEVVSERIAEIEQEVEEHLAEAIEQAGMEEDRFMEINMSLQQDPALQQRVQEKMMESQMEEQIEPEMDDIN